MRRERFYISILMFSLAGLLGPLLWWISNITGSIDSMHNVIAMLWPAWMLGTFEYTVGKIMAAVIAVGANVLIFASIGVFVALSLSMAWRFISFTVIMLILVWLNYWLNNWHIMSLLITIIIFGGLYWLLGRLLISKP